MNIEVTQLPSEYQLSSYKSEYRHNLYELYVIMPVDTAEAPF